MLDNDLLSFNPTDRAKAEQQPLLWTAEQSQAPAPLPRTLPGSSATPVPANTDALPPGLDGEARTDPAQNP
jgi:hypothetical protein